MRILLLGAYGLIGSEIARSLIADNHIVFGLGRNITKGLALVPQVKWQQADIAKLLTPQAWLPFLQDIEVIINASGALQSGLQDNLQNLQYLSMCALITAAQQTGGVSFIQISAPGAVPEATSEFLRTKALADKVLRVSQLNWLIFKPGLVLGPNTYGGTTLLRMLTALPLGVPLCAAQSQVQTVALDDVAKAIALSLHRSEVWCKEYDLVETQSHSLQEIVMHLRSWLGGSPCKSLYTMPAAVCYLVSRAADILGYFGWRSPLRSTSFKVLTDGVHGNVAAWEQASGLKLKSLTETLRDLPSTQQERLFAKIALLFPIGVFILVLFWFYSGLIGVVSLDEAARHLNSPYAKNIVIICSIIDLCIAGLLAFRGSFKLGIIASLIMATGYLVGGSLVTPDLWLDPLGPLAKILPVIMLTLMVRASLQER